MKRMEALYKENADIVYRFLLSLGADAEMAEELTAETLFRGVKKISSFREECRLSTWLCAIARNLYYDERKRLARLLPLTEAQDGDGTDMENAVADMDAAVQIQKSLTALPEPYGAVFSLHVLGEVPLSEISAFYEKSESWARVTFFRAKIMILERLKGGNL